MKRCNGKTRAGVNGKLIECSKCGFQSTVYHFNWSGLCCNGCKEKSGSTNPYDYLVDKADHLIVEVKK